VGNPFKMKQVFSPHTVLILRNIEKIDNVKEKMSLLYSIIKYRSMNMEIQHFSKDLYIFKIKSLGNLSEYEYNYMI
jgi:hypothetical protein